MSRASEIVEREPTTGTVSADPRAEIKRRIIAGEQIPGEMGEAAGLLKADVENGRRTYAARKQAVEDYHRAIADLQRAADTEAKITDSADKKPCDFQTGREFVMDCVLPVLAPILGMQYRHPLRDQAAELRQDAEKRRTAAHNVLYNKTFDPNLRRWGGDKLTEVRALEAVVERRNRDIAKLDLDELEKVVEQIGRTGVVPLAHGKAQEDTHACRERLRNELTHQRQLRSQWQNENETDAAKIQELKRQIDEFDRGEGPHGWLNPEHFEL